MLSARKQWLAMLHQPTPVPSASNASTHCRPLGQQCFNPLPSPRPAMLQPTPVPSASNASIHSRPLGQQCFHPLPSPLPAMLQPTPIPSASNASTHSRPLGHRPPTPPPPPSLQSAAAVVSVDSLCHCRRCGCSVPIPRVVGSFWVPASLSSLFPPCKRGVIFSPVSYSSAAESFPPLLVLPLTWNGSAVCKSKPSSKRGKKGGG